MDYKNYSKDVMFEISKDKNPKTLINFMRELCKISNMRQYSKDKSNEDIPKVISMAEYKKLHPSK